MLELIILIIIVAVIKSKSKNKSFTHHTPPITPVNLPKPKASSLTGKEISKQVNKQIYGTEAPQDRVTLYNRLILTDRYQNIEKIAHELGISKHQALREIKKLKEQGYYLQVTIDERNYRLIYPASVKTVSEKSATPAKPVQARKKSPPKPPQKNEEHSYIQPSTPYRPPASSGERYEEWMPVPAGKRVIHCSYCGADNLLSEKQDPHKCSCYFCREEL